MMRQQDGKKGSQDSGYMSDEAPAGAEEMEVEVGVEYDEGERGDLDMEMGMDMDIEEDATEEYDDLRERLDAAFTLCMMRHRGDNFESICCCS